jgi:hypothetical protein
MNKEAGGSKIKRGRNKTYEYFKGTLGAGIR